MADARRAKIIATIGPACLNRQIIKSMILAGTDIFRLNFSHGSYENHAVAINYIREISHSLSKPIGIIQDLQGPKIRLGELNHGEQHISVGQTVFLTSDQNNNLPNYFPVDFPNLPQYIHPGEKILIDDGRIELSVKEVSDLYIETVTVIGGILKSNKGLNIPGIIDGLPILTKKDKLDLEWGFEHGIDALAISFVRNSQDIQTVKKALEDYHPSINIPIIAKLENAVGINNLDEILTATDAIIVARGDLGVEIPPQEVPLMQKLIIEKATFYSKTVITATQMLESMIDHPKPTRAEISDVANAVFDGTDALMLSGETSIGKYPVESVKMMADTIIESEKQASKWGRVFQKPDSFYKEDDAYFICRAGNELAHDRNVAAIAIFTKSGKTAMIMSKRKPKVRILAFTSNANICNYMNLLWGVQPFLIPHVDSIQKMLITVDSILINMSDIEQDQQIVLICGFPVQTVRASNLTLLHTIGKYD